MKKYKVEKTTVLKPFTDMKKVVGYEVKPKNNVGPNEIKIAKMVILDHNFTRKILKKKIQRRLDFYVKSLIECIEDNNDESVVKALGDIERFKSILINKYQMFLDERYYQLLIKKLNNLYGKMQEKQLIFMAESEKIMPDAKKSK